MKKFNINDTILLQITDDGMTRLIEVYGYTFVKTIIMGRKEVINGEEWYRLQLHAFPDYFGKIWGGGTLSPIKMNIMIPDENLKEIN